MISIIFPFFNICCLIRINIVFQYLLSSKGLMQWEQILITCTDWGWSPLIVVNVFVFCNLAQSRRSCKMNGVAVFSKKLHLLLLKIRKAFVCVNHMAKTQLKLELTTHQNHTIRLDICQKIYTTGFSGKKIYTLKVHKFQLFLLKKKQRNCIDISYFSSVLLEFNWVCTILIV